MNSLLRKPDYQLRYAVPSTFFMAVVPAVMTAFVLVIILRVLDVKVSYLEFFGWSALAIYVVMIVFAIPELVTIAKDDKQKRIRYEKALARQEALTEITCQPEELVNTLRTIVLPALLDRYRYSTVQFFMRRVAEMTMGNCVGPELNQEYPILTSPGEFRSLVMTRQGSEDKQTLFLRIYEVFSCMDRESFKTGTCICTVTVPWKEGADKLIQQPRVQLEKWSLSDIIEL